MSRVTLQVDHEESLTLYKSDGSADITKNNNDEEVELLPLQRALDMELIAQSKSNGSSKPLSNIDAILFTEQDQTALDDSRTSNYLMYCIFAFGPIFAFALVEITYHMSSFIARERELGMSGLIDTMISGGSNFRGRIVRQASVWISFACVYLPSWISVGAIISAVVVPKTSQSLPLGFTILSGLALTSFSLFGASFFKKAQLSGSIMIIITVVGAILPVVLFDQDIITCAIISALFPAGNFTYYITTHAAFESQNRPATMFGSAYPPGSSMGRFRMPLIVHWIILVVHIVVLPPMAFAVEHWLRSTASPHRKFAKPSNDGDPTVTLSGFTKT